MHLDPTPLPDALNHLLESTTRVSALVQPAFGLAPPASQQHHNHNHNQENNTDTPGPEDGGGNTTPSSSREDRGHKRVVRVRYDLNHARSLLEQLRRVFCDGDSDSGGGAWTGVPHCRKRLIEMRQVAAVLGAGALVLYCLEGALRELVRLYEVEEGIRKGVDVGVGVGVGVGEGKGKGKGVRERDVDVVRWMRHERRAEVWDLMKGVKDFGTAVWSVMTIFESPSDDEAATGQANLWTAVADILCKENDLSKEINRLYPGLNPRASRLEIPGVSTIEGSSLGRDTFGPGSGDLIPRPARLSDNAIIISDIDDSDNSDSDSEADMLTPTSSEFPLSEPDEEGPELGYQLSLAPVINPGVVRVPVAMSMKPHARRVAGYGIDTDLQPPPIFDSRSLRVLTVSTAGVEMSPLPEDIDTSLPQRTPNKALSAEAVFRLPDITDKIVLDFFHRALEVSRFAAQFANGRFPHTGPQSAETEALQNLKPRRLRELCTDLYDELVRRNVEDQNKGRRESADKVQFVEPEGFNAKRRYARKRFAAMEDRHIVTFIAPVLRELDRRCDPGPYDASRVAECRAAAALHLEGTLEEEERRKGMEATWDQMWAQSDI
ncbi:uncharacterized protein B0H64DRAFT_171579 [Chaetomium fimeti]|uniref:GIT Spa2 homology (SHD) domain-containing protein n=1 Tax=Chaetomium fimeti TaxID=1854472 RepID=A0AAE0HH87_9PEZI|nr:hypothetical protein B0H64DRAFT_171579 [Chaetomium fimeti]